jgi:hypothetical protein
MNPADNIKIRQTWIEEEVEKIINEQEETQDKSFLMFGVASILDIQPDEIDEADITDGAQEKQIDYIHIEDNEGEGIAQITIIQAKQHNGFGSNVVIQMRNGLDWIFEHPKAEYQALNNEKFKNKIAEIRSLRSNYGPTNLRIHLFHVTIGDATNLSDEYLQEETILLTKYQSLGFGEFSFSQIGAHELIDLMIKTNRVKNKIDIELPIIYDANRASLVEFTQGDTKSIICSVKASELAKAASDDLIFDLNVRPFYGINIKVNKDIWNTCTGDDSSRFWFLNNGVTMVCKKFDFNRDPDNPMIKIDDAQIVNGCQTTVTIREAYQKEELADDVSVLLRLYSTDNPNLIDKITLTTNNQNKITDRDLRANDSVQRDIEHIMNDSYGYLYERKNKQYKGISRSQRHLVIPSPKAAQSYLAIVRLKPSNARGYLGAIWSDFYKEIFENVSVVDLIVTYKIYQICYKESRSTSKISGLSPIQRDCRVYGLFHIARTVGYLLTNDNWGHKNQTSIEGLLTQFDNDEIPNEIYDTALAEVVQLRTNSIAEHPVAAMYFKNNISQRDLNAHLRGS